MTENRLIIPTLDEYLKAVDTPSEVNKRGTESEQLELLIEQLKEFNGHPFKVQDDQAMDDLVESIEANGVLTPIVVRPLGERFYEIISGHRRVHASKRLGLKTVPAIARKMSDDEAVIAMVDANIQREEILPSERARAFKMKFDAISHQGKSTSGHDVPKLTVDAVGEEINMSGRQVKRYIRLLYLIPELLELVDRKKLQFVSAIDISYMDSDIQRYVYDYIMEKGAISPKGISKLRNMIKDRKMTREDIFRRLDCILSKPVGEADNWKSLTLKGEVLRKHFPPGYPSEMWESVILSLLKDWLEEITGVDDGTV